MQCGFSTLRSQYWDLNRMIKVRYQGRLGNLMYQYCLGRILAERHNLQLEADAIPGFPVTEEAVVGDVLSGAPIEFRGHRIPFADLLATRPDRPVFLKGNFERYEYYRDYSADIRRWLEPESRNRQLAQETIGPDDLVVHVRVGDLRAPVLRNLNRVTPFAYFRSILQRERWDRLHVVTEVASDPLPQQIASSFGGIIHSGTAVEDFELLRAARRIVMSVSTFAWWGAWLSDAEVVYFPEHGGWNPWIRWGSAMMRDHDLHIPDDRRYRYQSRLWGATELPYGIASAGRWFLQDLFTDPSRTAHRVSAGVRRRIS